MPESAETKRLYCNQCHGDTWHILKGSHSYDNRDSDLEGGPPWGEWGEYKLWACAGCDSCLMEDHYSADYLPQDASESIFHPKRLVTDRGAKSFVNLPARLGSLYREVIQSYNETLHLLCAAGLRSLLEGICADKNIKGADLEARIDGMRSLLPENIVKNLHGFRFIGNRALHDLEVPKKYELTWALDVIEDILNFLYALDYKAGLLEKIKRASAEPASAQGDEGENETR